MRGNDGLRVREVLLGGGGAVLEQDAALGHALLDQVVRHGARLGNHLVGTLPARGDDLGLAVPGLPGADRGIQASAQKRGHRTVFLDAAAQDDDELALRCLARLVADVVREPGGKQGERDIVDQDAEVGHDGHVERGAGDSLPRADYAPVDVEQQQCAPGERQHVGEGDPAAANRHDAVDEQRKAQHRIEREARVVHVGERDVEWRLVAGHIQGDVARPVADKQDAGRQNKAVGDAVGLVFCHGEADAEGQCPQDAADDTRCHKRTFLNV